LALKVERELYVGELSDWRDALVPLFSAVGGMAVPAIMFAVFNNGLPTISGFGIPMATDIAFAIGVLGLLGNRIPMALKVFLVAVAIIDDLGAILVIVLFYSKGFSLTWFGISIAVFAAMLFMRYRNVKVLWPYLAGGAVLWYGLHHAGIHATIAGVLTAFTIPFGDGEDDSPSHKLEYALLKPVAIFIVPVFALANAGLKITPEMIAGFSAPLSIGIIGGLVIGKPVGVLIGALLGRTIGGSETSEQISYWQYTGAGFLAGIGFTMSIFITLLAMKDPVQVDLAKGAVLAGSILAGIGGYMMLRMSSKVQV
jgi:NhaA family Na+:H+ antiporter